MFQLKKNLCFTFELRQLAGRRLFACFLSIWTTRTWSGVFFRFLEGGLGETAVLLVVGRGERWLSSVFSEDSFWITVSVSVPPPYFFLRILFTGAVVVLVSTSSLFKVVVWEFTLDLSVSFPSPRTATVWPCFVSAFRVSARSISLSPIPLGGV